MGKEKAIRELNQLARKIVGPKMTEEQLRFQDELRAKVRRGEITVEEGHEIWEKKYPEAR
jgi:hypothetical protein